MRQQFPELPRPLHSATTAMLVLDMQNDRVRADAPLFDPEAAASVLPTCRLLELARATDVRVVFIAQVHRQDGCDIGTFGVVHPAIRQRRALVAGTVGAQICEDLVPLPGEAVIHRRRDSAFFGTDLAIVLRSRGIATVVFTGFRGSRSLLPSLYDAIARDYRCIVVHDQAALSSTETGRYLDTLIDSAGADRMTVDGIANLIMRERL